MKLLDLFKHKDGIIDLVRRGMANHQSASTKQVRDCIFLLRNTLGDTWKMANREAAAGMALLALARDARLHCYLNHHGWKLVLSCVSANPQMARSLSPRAIGEIHTYRDTHPALPA